MPRCAGTAVACRGPWYDPASRDRLHTNGGARGPVILPVFKAGDPSLRGVDGGFDSHTLPPYSAECEARRRTCHEGIAIVVICLGRCCR